MAGFHAVADPVRLRIVGHLSEYGQATLAQLAEAASVHENTARQHVQALEQAGVLERGDGPPRGPGRPAAIYRLASGLTLSPTNLVGLAQLLAAVLLRTRPDRRRLLEAGRDWGRWLLGRPGAHRVEQVLPRTMEQLGFDVDVRDQEVVLSGCPCPLVAPDDPLLVCDLGAGVIDGVLAGSGGELRIAARDHDPPRRRCRVRLETVRGTGEGCPAR